MPKFNFLSELTARDIAFEAFGKTERQLLENSALALEETMVVTKTLRRRHTEQINLRAISFADLLFMLLEHLLFLKDAKGLLFRQVKLGVSQEGKSWLVQGFAYGEKIDPGRHGLKVDIHSDGKQLFSLDKSPTGVLRAQVILKTT